MDCPSWQNKWPKSRRWNSQNKLVYKKISMHSKNIKNFQGPKMRESGRE